MLRFSADGRRLATGEWRFIGVYDTATWIEVQCIETDAEFRDLTISPTGAKVATAGMDRFDIVTTDVDELLELARQRITRDFIPEECATYRLDSCPPVEDTDDGEN